MAMWLIVPCGTVVFLHGSVSGSICTRKLVAYLTCTYVHTEYIIIIVVIVVISLGFYSRDTYVRSTQEAGKVKLSRYFVDGLSLNIYIVSFTAFRWKS